MGRIILPTTDIVHYACGCQQLVGSLQAYGSTNISLIVSDDEPKRIVGVKVDLATTQTHRWVYIAAFDVRLRGPVCGAHLCRFVKPHGRSGGLAGGKDQYCQ